MTGAVRLWRRPLALSLAVLLLACGPPAPRETKAPAPDDAAQAEPAPLAEARLPDSPLVVRITGVARSGPEVLEVAFALVNPGAVSAAPPAGPGIQGDEWLAGAYVIEEHGKRFYVMRDAQGRAKCTAAPAQIGPGGRQALSARFPAPAGEAGRITVVVPGVPPFRGIPFPGGTGAAGPSY